MRGSIHAGNTDLCRYAVGACGPVSPRTTSQFRSGGKRRPPRPMPVSGSRAEACGETTLPHIDAESNGYPGPCPAFVRCLLNVFRCRQSSRDASLEDLGIEPPRMPRNERKEQEGNRGMDSSPTFSWRPWRFNDVPSVKPPDRRHRSARTTRYSRVTPRRESARCEADESDPSGRVGTGRTASRRGRATR